MESYYCPIIFLSDGSNTLLDELTTYTPEQAMKLGEAWKRDHPEVEVTHVEWGLIPEDFVRMKNAPFFDKTMSMTLQELEPYHRWTTANHWLVIPPSDLFN